MLQEVKLSIPKIMCHLEYQDPSRPLVEDMIIISRVLPGVPQKGDQVAISTDSDWLIGEVVLVRWHFSAGSHDGAEYVTVKVRALPRAGESEAGNG